MPYKDHDKQARFQREWMAKRRAAWEAANPVCVRCGGSDRIQLDHIDPTKKVSHRIWSWRAARREAELAKCQPLCLKCHGAKSGDERRKPPVHGTRHCYDEYRCRCPKCVRAQRDYMDDYRVRKAALAAKAI